jgi:multiple sugar transport system ATP-binding protein
VGRAIVRQPKVFLFDEPLSNLDAKLRVQMRAEIIALHKRLSATMVYVTHDQIEAMTMGDKIVVMKDGLVQQIGAPLHVYHHPANKFVAGFIGSPPMNFINGALSERDGGLCIGKIRAAGEHAEALKPHLGKELVAGIRPEDFVLCAEGEQASEVSGAVSMTEPLGGEINLHLVTETGVKIIARMGPDRLFGVGERVCLNVRNRRIKYFDVQTEKALLDI